MKTIFTKRNVLGSLLFLALVGEVTVGAHNGLFTPAGLVVLLILYFVYFLLLESLIARYDLNNLSLVLVNFALYSVLITGLLHGELADYVLKPEESLITTLIRIQCSLYPLFAFYVLRYIAPREHPVVSVKMSTILFISYIVLLSFSGAFGVGQLVQTFELAPIISSGFGLAAVLSLVFAVRTHAKPIRYSSRSFGILSVLLLTISLIPGLPGFMVLLLLMITISVMYLLKASFRDSTVV